MSKTVTEGSTVTLHYRGTDSDGEVFDDSRERGEPMVVEAGSGGLIAGFESALGGMGEGETKTVTIGADDAYGHREDEAIVDLEKTIFPEDFEFTAGMTVPLTGPGGRSFMATVTDITEEGITADLNHPLAGKDLTFTIEVLSIESQDETPDS